MAFASSCFTPSSKILVTGGSWREVRVRDVTTKTAPEMLHVWTEASLTQAMSFDTTGERIAYSTQTSVVVRRMSDGEELQRLEGTACSQCEFCPADADLLLLGTGMGRDNRYFGRRIVLYSISTGQPLVWSPLFHSAFALDKVSGWSVGWSINRDNGRLLMRAAEAEAVVEYDKLSFEQSVEDGAFTTAQLVNLANRYPASVAVVALSQPHCVCIRDAISGDTVLHHLARSTGAHMMKKWLGSGGAVFTPIANRNGWSALHDAIQNFNVSAVVLLLGSLSPNINAASAALLTDALRMLAVKMPRLVLSGFLAMEPSIVQRRRSFRCSIMQTMVRGLDTLHDDAELELSTEEDAEVGLSPVMKASGLDDINGGHDVNRSKVGQAPNVNKQEKMHLWQDLEMMPASADGVVVYASVVALKDFIGSPEISPIHAIVDNCEAKVFSSELLRLAIMYKWQTNVYRLVLMHVMIHIVCLAISSASMIYTTQRHLDETVIGDLTSHVLQGATIACSVLTLMLHILRVVRQSWARYMETLWNAVDAVSSLMLIAAATGHIADVHTSFIQTLGVIGVSLKWFGLLDYLRSFRRFGPLVRMIVVVTNDIGPFVAILLLVVIGSTFFFTINLPGEAAWSPNNVFGPFWPALTMIQFVLGNFDMNDYPKSTSVVMFLCVAFFVVILMLNLLIAIMQDSYDKVKEHEVVEGLREKGKTIVAMEQLWPRLHTFPKFMHIAMPQSDVVDLETVKRARDQGMGGRISERLSEQFDARISALDKKFDDHAQQLDQKIDCVTNEMSRLAALLQNHVLEKK
eukprot:SAG31_NODE_4737_length_2991_cov_1.986169_1_plen_802_part_00